MRAFGSQLWKQKLPTWPDQNYPTWPYQHPAGQRSLLSTIMTNNIATDARLSQPMVATPPNMVLAKPSQHGLTRSPARSQISYDLLACAKAPCCSQLAPRGPCQKSQQSMLGG